ncbi:peptidyl-tRNA hydrolase [Austwickia chelonae]|uniref:peptidyl-tRNA hydrolase n=1 Tax=Austwickia chelonae TaxID=100225 RepID=UPI001F07EF3A|nr:peptidyl-tRNA hydrolase [Austwickia chelonae]
MNETHPAETAPASPTPRDPDEPWGMQLAVRYDKNDLSSHRAVCEAAAQAVVSLLADERARGEGAWAADVHHWRRGRIRKLVRRARGIRWERAQEIPGVTVDHHGAQVRAFVPMPARPLPKILDDLQVAGTDFPREDDSSIDESAAQVVIALNPAVKLSSGKAAAQCGHAAQLAWERLVLDHESAKLRAWFDQGWRVLVLDAPTPARWSTLEDAPVRVVDAGLTEVDGPTETARAFW